MSDKDKIDKLMDNHYKIMATKNVWYNLQWYKATTLPCVMASELRFKLREVK